MTSGANSRFRDHCLAVIRLTAHAATARVLHVTVSVDAFMNEYIRRYSERDVEGVTELCL